MSSPSTPLPVGTLVDGKYRIDRVLGAGGMGVVVVATDVRLDRPVALKFVQREALGNPEVVRRFTREARAAGRLKSEHVARVHDVGALGTGEPYIVMEYLEGEDLARVIARGGRQSVAEAVDWTLQACEALAEAHAQGIVHRDIKPSNLFLESRPSGKPLLKVLDFGISKTPPSASEAGLTTTSAVVGSPLYMSPEQMTSARDVDARSDVWSLGLVLYELLTGSNPFQADSLATLVLAIAHKAAPSLRDARPEVAAGLDAAILRCLSKKREQRFAGMADLAQAIAPFGPPGAADAAGRIERVLSTPSKALGDTPSSAEEYATTTPSRTPPNWTPPGTPEPFARRAPRVAMTALVGVLLLAGAAAIFASRGGSSDAASAETSSGAIPSSTAAPSSSSSSIAPTTSLPSLSEEPLASSTAAPSSAPEGGPRPRAAPEPARPAIPRMQLK
jgi:eukaryotic-like serine/threonine-protein kinase